MINIDDIKDNVQVNIGDVRDLHAMSYFIKGKDYLFNLLAGQTSHIDSMNDPFTDLNINSAAQLSIQAKTVWEKIAVWEKQNPRSK